MPAPPPTLTPAAAADARRLLGRLLTGAGALAALMVFALIATLVADTPALREWGRAGLAHLPLATLAIGVGALASARLAATDRFRRSLVDVAMPPDRALHRAQLAVMLAAALAALALAWSADRSALPPEAPPATALTLAALAAALAFPLLIAERTLAATPATMLPEAASLRALALLAAGVTFAASLAELAAGLALPYTPLAKTLLVGLVGIVALELGARAAGRAFLPPSHAIHATAPVRSLIARTLAGAPTDRGGPGARVQFGRSWALAYMRAAAAPMAAGLLLAAWLLSGVVVVPLDGRAIAERFGAPVAVLHPGLHTTLPWPLGGARALEYGTIHALGLTGALTTTDAAPAEAPAPASADRLWNEPHPEEVTLLIASAGSGAAAQSFQALAADIRVLYRIGLSDAAALAAAYAAADPAGLVRAEAGRAVTRYFAGKTLDAALVADREAAAASMRAAIQQALDARHAGLDVIDVTIEAIHPPAGAADAYHNVRAAEIASLASIATERGNAATIAAQAQQYAFDQTSQATAAGAETTARARQAGIRFDADRGAAHANSQSFTLERYLATLTGALARAPKTIIDHRLNYPEAPVLDLRPLAPAAAGSGGAKED